MRETMWIFKQLELFATGALRHFAPDVQMLSDRFGLNEFYTEDNYHDGVVKLTIQCMSCSASGINDEGCKAVVGDVTHITNWQSQ